MEYKFEINVYLLCKRREFGIGASSFTDLITKISEVLHVQYFTAKLAYVTEGLNFFIKDENGFKRVTTIHGNGKVIPLFLYDDGAITLLNFELFESDTNSIPLKKRKDLKRESEKDVVITKQPKQPKYKYKSTEISQFEKRVLLNEKSRGRKLTALTLYNYLDNTARISKNNKNNRLEIGILADYVYILFAAQLKRWGISIHALEGFKSNFIRSIK